MCKFSGIVLFALYSNILWGQTLVPFKNERLWGFKDEQQNIVIPAGYQFARPFMGKGAIVAKENKFGVIDRSNKTLVDFTYEILMPLDSALVIFGTRAKYFGEFELGVMTYDETIVIPRSYAHIRKQNNTLMVTLDTDSIIGRSPVGDMRAVRSKMGVFDLQGKEIIPCVYEYIQWKNDSLLDVSVGEQQNNHALFDKNGKQLTSFDYMVFGAFIEGVAKARIGNKFGFVYPAGEIAVPVKFDYCEDFKNGYALIEAGEKWGAIDKKGNIVIEPLFTHQETEAKLEVLYRK